MWKQHSDQIVLGIITFATYWLQTLAWPLFLGRDAWTYLYYYLDFWSTTPVYHYVMVRRTPVAPFLFGNALTFGGVFFTEMLLAVFYCLAIGGIYWLGNLFSRRIGWLVALLINFYPAYGQRFHAVETENPSALILILICILAFSAFNQPKSWKFGLLGLLTVIFCLTRPDHVAFIALAALPFLLPNTTLAERTRLTLVFVLISGTLLLAWSTYNYLRYDDFALSRGGQAHIPFQRAFEFSHTVAAENGPASADLIKVIETELLTKEPYKSYGIDSETFLASATERMFYDLPGLSDLHYGWDSDYNQLQKTGWEAVRAHPLPFIWSYIKSAGVMFLLNSTQPASRRESNEPLPPQLSTNGLPIPTKGDVIPRTYYLYIFSSPGAKSLPDPNSIEFKILDPKIRAQTAAMETLLDHFRQMVPNRDGSEVSANVLNFLTTLFPPAIFWLVLSAVGLMLNPTRKKLLLIGLCGISLVVILFPIVGINPVPIMRIRFDPLFVLAGLLGLRELAQRVRPLAYV